MRTGLLETLTDQPAWGTTATLERPSAPSTGPSAGCLEAPGAAPTGPALNAGWILIARASETHDAIVLTEYGTLWWAEIEGRTARLLRTCYRDEIREHERDLGPTTRMVLRLG